MKKQILALISTLAAASGFAIDAPLSVETVTTPVVPHEFKTTVIEKISPKSGFVYFRMGVADTQAHQVPQMDRTFFIPGAGLGYRMVNGAYAVDISANYTQGFAGDKNSRSYSYSLPKVSVLGYLSPLASESFYAGLGLGVVKMRNVNASAFTGVDASAVVGFEMNRKANWRSFMELIVSQPTLAFVRENSFPGPVAEFALGFGY